MLLKLTVVGLVLIGLVLAVPTTRTVDEQSNQQIDRFENEKKEDIRRDMDSIEGSGHKEFTTDDSKETREKRRPIPAIKSEKRDSTQKLDDAKETDSMQMEKETERRGTDSLNKEEEKERASQEKEEEKRAIAQMEKEKKIERRGVEALKKEAAKEENRRGTEETKEKEQEKRAPMQMDMQMEKKEEERRGVENLEKEEEKETTRRASEERKDKEKEKRMSKKMKEKQRRALEAMKKEAAKEKEAEKREAKKLKEKERRGVEALKKEAAKEENRRGTEETKEKEAEKREAKKLKEKERRGVEALKKEAAKEENRRGTEETKEKEQEKRAPMQMDMQMEKKETERRGVEALKKEAAKEENRRGTEETKEKEQEKRASMQLEKEKEEERRGTDNLTKEEEKEQEKRAPMQMDMQMEKKETERRGVEALAKEAAKEENRRGTEETKEKEQEKRAFMQLEKEKEEERRGTDNLTKEEEKEQEKRESTNNESLTREKRTTKEQEETVDEKKVSRDVAKNGSLAICESVTDFKYFQKYESDPSKYIQCDPWGSGHVKQCADGLFWNEWTLKCDAKENIRNMTLDLSKFSVTTVGQPRVNCSLVGMECLNGGSCVQSVSGDYRCACRSDYTGQYCESRVDLSDVTHEILNGTFSVAAYRRHLQQENVTMSAAFYEKYKSQLDNATYSELVAYLNMYKDGEVRFDTLANSLVEDILENIYPDAEYLSVFNASEQNVIAMVQMVPSLLSYSRYSFERYQDVFAQYQSVLAALVPVLNSSLPTIAQEATQYTRLTSIFLNQTLALLKGQQQPLVNEDTAITQPIQLTDADIKKALQANYNQTMQATEKLLAILETFQASVAKEIETNPAGVVNMTLGSAKFPGAQEMLVVLNEVSVASAQIWDSLVNYGFWFLTNTFSTSVNKVDSIQKFSFSLNKF